MDLLEKEISWLNQELSLQEVRDRLKQQADFYRENNIKLKEALMKLNLLKEDLSLECQNELSKLVSFQEAFETVDCKAESLTFSHVDQLRKQNAYIAKVKTCRKMYINLNEKIAKEIKRLRSEYEHSKNQVERIMQVSNDELKVLEVKIKRHEEQLTKLEERNPWLKDSKLNLSNIATEIQALNNLKQKKLELMKELEVYQGLKPDLIEAHQQLDEIKRKYEDITNSFK